MKRPWLILVGGVAIALLAYCGSFYAGSASYRCLMHSSEPELAWLQQEFHIPAAEFDRISKLHAAYTAGCADRCRRIDAVNAGLKALLAGTNAVTPAVEKTLQEAALLRAECQAKMLEHFYSVSRTMPPGQSRRYLDWILDRTFGPEHAAMTLDTRAADHESHQH